MDELKKLEKVGAIIYRYRCKTVYVQTEKPVFYFFKKKILTEFCKSEDNLTELIKYVDMLNIPLIVYSYPIKVNEEDFSLFTSYNFTVYANFPLMLINHLKNILIIHDKIS